MTEPPHEEHGSDTRRLHDGKVTHRGLVATAASDSVRVVLWPAGRLIGSLAWPPGDDTPPLISTYEEQVEATSDKNPGLEKE